MPNKISQTCLAMALFAAGALSVAALSGLIEPAQADEIKWSEAVHDPEFRAAVADVINGCIIENGIIYCN